MKSFNRTSPVVADQRNSSFFTLNRAFATAILLSCLASPMQAAITWSGYVSPGDPTKWYDLTQGYIGRSPDSGSITVDNASSLRSNSCYIGGSWSSESTATVTGTGSTWINDYALYIGHNGPGRLNIVDGGQVSSYWGHLGFFSTGTSTVTVTGTGSMWTNSGTLYIGESGTGALNIEAGGQVSSSSGILGNDSASRGTATVNGIGSKWTNSGNLQLGRMGCPGTLNIQAGGEVSNADGQINGSLSTATVNGIGSKWTNSGTLYVGDFNGGTLNIEAGGQVSSSSGIIGDDSASPGTATVNGIGSKWTNSGNLYVGRYGLGTLNIEAGGQVSNADGYVGDGSLSPCTVTVNGIGSKWTNSGNLYIGKAGTGTLTVNDGGMVVVGGAIYAASSDLFGNGTISANGGVLDAELVFDAAHGSQATSSFGSGGTLTITPSANNPLGVGNKNSGTLRIAEAMAVVSSYGYLGLKSGSSGTATVNGAGSTWSISNNLYVGNSGSGTLNIEAGGQVNNTNGYLGCVSSSTVTVNGADSKWTSNNLYVGYTGTGTLNIGCGIASDGMVVASSVIFSYSGINAKATCNLNGGTLQTTSITKGTGTTTFNWSDGTIRNYNASTDLTVNGTNSLSLKLAATGTHAFNIDAGRKGTVSAILCDATSGGTLAKQGDGLLVLSAVNTYSGTTTIESGQLKLVAGGDIAFSSEIINRAGFMIDGGNHAVKMITGSGSTQVVSGSLTAGSIVQDTLTIGGTTNAVPEPASFVLLAIFSFAVARMAWGRRER